MFHPFSLANTLFSARQISPAGIRTSNGATAGDLGGAAPQSPIVGVRRDIGFVPQFLPSMTIVGGLKQPPRF